MLTVYTAQGCFKCKAAMRWLDKRGAAYQAVDIDQAGMRETLREAGHRALPVITDGTTWVADFRPDQLAKLVA